MKNDIVRTRMNQILENKKSMNHSKPLSTDLSDMFVPRHSAFEKEENVEGATKWIIAFCIFLVVGILLANHFNFQIQ